MKRIYRSSNGATCASCKHSHYESLGKRRDSLVCETHPPAPRKGQRIVCRVGEGDPACPSYKAAFSMAQWRTEGTRPHRWQSADGCCLSQS